jgi:hypothetical protein
MPVTCEHCKKPIESKEDLIVMTQWGFIPRPLHKQCWGNLAVSHGGAGSVSYGTGAFRRKRGFNIAVNSTFFKVIAIVGLFIGLFILTLDLSTGTFTVNGVERAPTSTEAIGIKAILFFICMIPLLIRIWSYKSIESKL